MVADPIFEKEVPVKMAKTEKMEKMEKIDLLIKNAKVVTSIAVTEGAIGIKNGKIIGIYKDSYIPESKEVIDVKGNYVLPGLVDPEAHLGIHRPMKDDLISETRAALAGGVTTWGFQFTSPNIRWEYKKNKDPEDVKLYSEVFPVFKEMGEQFSMIDFFFTPILMNDEQAEEVPELAKKLGITSYKLYLHLKKGAETFGAWEPQRKLGFYGFDEGTVYLSFEKVAEIGSSGLLAIHCENWEIARVFEKRLRKAGRKDMGAWDDRSPHFCEAGHVREYTYYAKITGCPVYIQHVTTKETLLEIAKARCEGVKVTGQSGPHYLSLPRDVYKINVPLRDTETIEILWKAFRDGYVDCVGSDHVNHGVPRNQMEVKGDVWATVSGFSSRVEAMLPVMLSEGVNKGRISLERMVEICSENPAKAFGIFPQKGTISLGSDADLLVVDLDRKYKISSKDIFTSSGWSIYEGREMKGLLMMSILKGKPVLKWVEEEKKHEIFGKPGGKYLPRNPKVRPYPIAWSCPSNL